MHELSVAQSQQISAGIDNLSAAAALSMLSGTAIGGSLGTAIALNITVPSASLVPVWIAACTGAGGAIGTLVGIAFVMGTFSVGCGDSVSRK